MTEVEIERIVVRLVGDQVQYQRMLRDAARATELFGAHMTTTMTAIAVDASRGLMAVGLPLAAVGAVAVKSFSDFDKALTESAAIMKVTDEQFARMRQEALDLSEQGPQSATELARAFYALASAGLHTEQAIAALPVVQKFATAGMFDLSTAARLATSAQSALGMRVEDSMQNMHNLKRITDVLSQANILAEGTIEDFARALTNDAAAAMRVYGVSLEQGVAVLATMAQQGNKGLTAGTDFARILRLVTNAAIEHADTFQRLNIQFFDTNGNLRDLADVVGDLEKALGGMSAELRGATLKSLGFEARIQGAALPLIGFSSKIREFEEVLRKAGGTTDDIAQKTMRSFAIQMQMAQNMVQNVGIEIGTTLLPVLSQMVIGVRAAVRVWRDLSAPMRVVIIYTAAAVGLVGSLAAVLYAASFAMMLLTGPAVAVLGTILAVGTGLVIWEAALGDLDEQWRGLAATLQEAFRGLQQGLDVARTAGQAALIILGKGLAYVRDNAGQLRDYLLAMGTTALGWVNQFLVDNDVVRSALAGAAVGVALVAAGLYVVWRLGRAAFVLLGWAVRGAAFVVGQLGAGMLGVVGYLSDLAGGWLSWVKSALTNTRSLVGTVVAVGTAITVVVVAFKIMAAVLAFLKVQQILSTVLWAAWGAAVLAVQLVIYTWTAAVAVANFATLLWNVGLAALNVLIAPATIIAAAATIIILATAFTLVASVVYGVYQAVSATLEVLDDFAAFNGPIAAVTDIFREWGRVLQEIFRAVKVGGDLGWRYMQAGWNLAVAQIAALMPPLWEFIQQGFNALWDVVTNNFEVGFYKALGNISTKMLSLPLTFLDPTGTVKKQITDALEGVNKEADVQIARQKDLAKQQLALATKGFKVKETPDVQAARKALDELRKELEEAEKKPPDIGNILPTDKWTDQAEETGKGMGHALGKGLKHGLEHFDAALFYSAEAQARIRAFQERLIPRETTRALEEAAYQEKLREERRRARQEFQPVSFSGAPFTLPAFGPPPSEQLLPGGVPSTLPKHEPIKVDDMPEAVELLRRLVELNEQIATKNTIELFPGGLS